MMGGLDGNGQCWKRFCAPLKNVQQGSIMMVTTRCQKVADKVGTMDPITLTGLQDEVFWNFFKLCVFESGSSNNNDPELERIGRIIVPKLKGSPLAAKTLGRILRMNLQAEHWNAILESELWKLKQEDTEILPALRLSYMYLPFHLKRCFSLCALYPKDYKFQKGYLAEIWVAEGFVEPQGDIPVQDIGCEYFNDLLSRSFFQEVQRGYVIHDLLHDMAQKVSEFDCFIVKRRSDFKNIPPNVRHLSILSSTDIGYSDLKGLSCFTKLRTLLCDQPLVNKTTPPSLVATWCSEFPRLRVIGFATTHELPPGIGNLKHLRYLQISKACPIKSLPTEFCRLYNLQIVCVQKCMLESLPTDFSKLISLQRFESHGFRCDSLFRRFQKELYYEVHVDVANDEQEIGFRLIKNINQLGELVIYNIGKPISKEHAAQAQLHNKKYLEKMILKWSLLRNPDDNDTEVLRFLRPPTCLKSLLLQGYPGVTLHSWFPAHNLPSLMSSSLTSFYGLESSPVSSITDLIVDRCKNLSSLEHIIHPAYMPALKKMVINYCSKLVSVPAERFGDLRCFEELEVQGCPNIYFQSLVAPSLKRLVLYQENDFSKDRTYGNLAEHVDCCSLTYFFLSSSYLTSIQIQKWNLPALEELHILQCLNLTSITGQSGQANRGTEGVRSLPSLTSLTIELCEELSTIDLVAEEYLPAIERIHLRFCYKLVSLPGEWFGNFSSLKELEITYCSRLSWRGFVLPTSLQILSLYDCGDISAWVPSCLVNLASLVTLKIIECRRITSIPDNLWSTNLTSLENLLIWNCSDIVSIGGGNAISEIKNVSILACPKLEELKQPMLRGSYLVS